MKNILPKINLEKRWLMLMELKVISKSFIIIIIHCHPGPQSEEKLFGMRVCYASSRHATHTEHEATSLPTRTLQETGDI